MGCKSLFSELTSNRFGKSFTMDPCIPEVAYTKVISDNVK